MRPYVVRQGDYLTKLAHRWGFDAIEVWNAEENSALRASRPNPEILHPGDVLHVPDPAPGMSIRPGDTKRFRAAPATIPVRIRLLDPEGRPLVDKAFVVRGAGDEVRGTTDGEGVARFDAHLTARHAVIQFEETGHTWRIAIGDMDPISEPSGVAKRLRHLGYLTGRDFGRSGVYGGALSRAVADFQVRAGIEPTGRVDEPTKEALLEAHGS